MLKFMRKHATSFMIKALFAVIIIVFIFWGVGSFREKDKVVAEVGPYKIYYTEYAETYKRFLNMYKMIYKDNIDENLLNSLKIKEKVMDDLIERYVMLIIGKKMGIHVSDKELTEHITSLNAFKRNGKFDKKLYEEVLKRYNMDPKKFEEGERTSIITTKLINILIDNAVFLTDEDLWNAYKNEKGQVDLSYTIIDPVDFTGKVSISEKELEDIYEKDKAMLKGENTYRLKYIVLDEKTKMKDDDVYLALVKTEDFEGFAKKNGLDVIELNGIKESELGKRFNNLNIKESLKGLKKGEISLPVRSDNKSYIFKVIDIEEGRLMDKSVALKQIRDRLIQKKAKEYAKTIAEEKITKKDFNPAKNTGFVARNATAIPKIGQIPPEHLSVLSLSQKEPIYKKPVEIEGKFYVFSYKDEKLPDKKEWERDKELYKRFVTSKKGEEFLKSFLDEMKKKEKIKINWQDL
ncbi:MAG TPA: SurA N-terminal domain-containing protein [Syntrophorhabdaceae bacterium]|nr:SurA N-terminal domain-containing protein [Syntrophorhabdaceae bacterium]